MSDLIALAVLLVLIGLLVAFRWWSFLRLWAVTAVVLWTLRDWWA
jgi:hypothetical protein